jgi:hypothetical protein
MATIVKVANKNASREVTNRIPFDGNNTFGRWSHRGLFTSAEDEVYVVYSYGRHFPMYAYSTITQQWYENEDGYSKTTVKHKAQLRPDGNIRVVPHGCIVTMAKSGLVELLKHQIMRGLLCRSML